MSKIYWIRDKMDIIFLNAAIFLFAVGILATLFGVLFRYVPGLPSLTWAEEITRMTIIASIFFVAGIGLRNGTQMCLTMILEKLPAPWFQLLTIVNQVFMIIFLFIICYYGINLAVLSVDQLSPVLQLSMFYPYLIIPIGAALMIIENVITIIETSTGKGQPKHDHSEMAFVD